MFIPAIFARMLHLSKLNCSKLLCDDEMRTGLHILIPESGHTSECSSDFILEISSLFYFLKHNVINVVLITYMRMINKNRPYIIRVFKNFIFLNYFTYE